MLAGDLTEPCPQLGFDIGNRPWLPALGGAVLAYEATGSALGDPETSLQGDDRPAATLRG
jgi:hypothetical protein